MGRHKKYTPTKLRKAINKYFDSITYERKLTEMKFDKYNENGKPIYKEHPIENNLGEQATIQEYTEAPTLIGLARYLGVDRTTISLWRSRAAGDKATEEDIELGRLIDGARDRIEEYNIKLLSTGKSTRGAMFNLNCNFGWSETQKVAVSGGGVEDYLKKLDTAAEEESATVYEY